MQHANSWNLMIKKQTNSHTVHPINVTYVSYFFYCKINLFYKIIA